MIRTRGSQPPLPVKRIKPSPRGAQLPNYSTVLFIWCQWKSPATLPFSLNIIREIARFMVSLELLPAVFNQRLYVLNVTSGQHQSVGFTEYERAFFVAVNSYQAACVCIKDESYKVYMVEYATLALTDLNIQADRVICTPKGCHVSNMLCVFISTDFLSTKYTLHKYSLVDKIWSKPDTEALTGGIILAVPYKDLVCLLLTSAKGDLYRTYNVHTDQFTVKGSIPIHPCLGHNYPWVKLESNRLFCLMKGLNYWIWDYNSEGKSEMVNKISLLSPFTQGITILRGRELYWIEEEDMRSCKYLAIVSYNIDGKTMHKQTVGAKLGTKID